MRMVITVADGVQQRTQLGEGVNANLNLAPSCTFDVNGDRHNFTLAELFCAESPAFPGGTSIWWITHL